MIKIIPWVWVVEHCEKDKFVYTIKGVYFVIYFWRFLIWILGIFFVDTTPINQISRLLYMTEHKVVGLGNRTTECPQACCRSLHEWILSWSSQMMCFVYNDGTQMSYVRSVDNLWLLMQIDVVKWNDVNSLITEYNIYRTL